MRIPHVCLDLLGNPVVDKNDALTAFEDEAPWGLSVLEINSEYLKARIKLNKMRSDALDKVGIKRPVTRNFLNFVRI